MKSFALVFAAMSLTMTAFAGPSAFKGKPLPAFSAKTLDGKMVSNATLKGKVVVLDFWATWCGPCKASMPMIERLHKKFGASGVVVIGASIDEPTATSAKYVKSNGFTYNFITEQNALSKKLGIEGIPVLMVIDRSGKVQLVKESFSAAGEKQEEAELSALIAKLRK